MNLKNIALILHIIVSLGLAIEFNSALQPNKKRCFYQILSIDQKYKVDLYPHQNSPSYNFSIQYLNKQNNKWQIQYDRYNLTSSQSLHVHKLATLSSTFRFCIYNPSIHNIFHYYISINSGLQLLQLHLLPDNSDAENIAIQMEWLQTQTKNLISISNKLNNMRMNNQYHTSTLSLKNICIFIAFTAIVISMNVLFYKKIKLALNQRKIM